MKKNIPDNKIQHDHTQLDLPKYIDKAKFVKNKKGHYSLQFMGWLFWTFLFIPLFTAVLWVFQGNLIKNYIFAEQFSVQLLNIVWLAIIVVCFGSALLLWASFNWIRYRKNDAVNKVGNVSNATLAEYLNISTEDLECMKKSKRVVLHYDEEGTLYDYQMNRISKNDNY